MKMRRLIRFLVLRDVRSALVGSFVVFGGIGLSVMTLIAHQKGAVELAGLAALLSLVFVFLILVFVVPPLARNATAEIAQMDLPMDLTAGGIVYAGLVLVVAFAAWNTGNNILFLLLSLLLAAVIVGAVAGGLSIRGLDVKLRLPEFIFAGEETSINVSVINRKRIFPTYSVLVELRGREKREGVLSEFLRELLPSKLASRFGRSPVVKHTVDYVVTIPRRSESTHRAKYIFPRRGEFLIKDFELSTSFPFGILRHRRRLSARESEIIIYPRLDQGSVGESPTRVGGDSGLSDRESSDDFHLIREYNISDDVRSIEWKATARTGKLMIREAATSTDPPIVIHVDPRVECDMDPEDPRSIRRRFEIEREHGLSPEEELFERVVSRAAALAIDYSEKGRPVRIIAGDGDTGLGIGNGHLHSCLTLLAKLSPELVAIQATDGKPVPAVLDDAVVITLRSRDFIEGNQIDINTSKA